MKYIYLLLLIPFTVFSNPIHTELGQPFSETTPLDIIERFEFTSGIKCDYGVPLWVSYNLNKDWFGETPRFTGNFIVDSLLPQECWIKHSDYTNSGYDRGHMVRSEERTRSVDENKATFRTSNIIPQLPQLNQQTWLKLEYYAEKLAKDSLKEMFIYTGPVFSKFPVTKYKDKVAIPDSCYKIIVVMPYGSTINDVNESTEIIACMFPNDDPDVKNHDWTEYKTTINHIENSTGFNFLSALPETLQDKLEGRATSVKTYASQDMLIYPNPATDYVIIPAETYTVYNSMGMLIGNYSNERLDVSLFPSGVYFVRFENEVLSFVK